MKKFKVMLFCFLFITILSWSFLTSSINAGPVQDLIDSGAIKVMTMSGGGANVFIKSSTYSAMTYDQKLGLCLHIMLDYNVNEVYGWKWGSGGSYSDMLFAHSSPKGFRIYR